MYDIVVTITEAIARRGAPVPTGTAFMTYAAAAGPDVPVVCTSQAQATTAAVPDAIAAFVGDALSIGAPEVVIVRTAALDNAAVTQAEWTTALNKFTEGFGAGQVMIPGVSTAAAYAALVAHAAATKRTALLDTIAAPVPATIATTAAGLAAAAGAEHATILPPHITVPGPGGTTRNVVGSVAAAGLAARSDQAVGHANNAPIFDQGRGAGFVPNGLGTTKAFTKAEIATMNDAGISVFNTRQGLPVLEAWVSLSDDPIFRQLNTGRFVMQIADGIASGAYQFQGRGNDGRSLLTDFEGWLRGYLQQLWDKGALYGATADEAFDVDVASVNDDETAAAGELNANVAVSLTQHTQKVQFNVSIAIASPLAA